MSVYFEKLDAHVLREGPWKLIRYPFLDRTQLFNLSDDPYELRDLVSAGEHAPRIAAMMKTLADEMRAAGVKRNLTTDLRIPSEMDWSKVRQKMDDQQPDWIRQRFSLPRSK